MDTVKKAGTGIYSIQDLLFHSGDVLCKLFFRAKLVRVRFLQQRSDAVENRDKIVPG